MAGSTAERNPRVGVLALQGAFREHERALRDVGMESVEVRQPKDLEGVRGLVIPGGESTTMSKLMAAYGLEQPIRDLHAGGAPVFGTCAGMILIARDAVDGLPDQRTLGLIDITVRRNAFGRQVASFEADLRLANEADPLTGVFIRAPWIESAGTGVELLASHAGHGVAARQGRVLVTAFHPELTADRRLHRLFASMVSSAREAEAA
ncbi:MAG TPA: pyridoxal 5'-phosphate synthase glutaminase subunit PdxT [Gaiellales bacterium]|nr:pyridoxal 5'-phosphate synthase glutaminase subunit PdxT [Gaiellales bacterium]